MFKKGFHLFRLWGIPVELNISWLLIFALVTWSFATGYIPENYPGIFSIPLTWILSFITAILLFLSVLLHEFSHSLVAVRNGLPIRKITLFMFGGVAQMSREVDSPSLELKMAAAGPLFTLVLASVLHALAFLVTSIPFLYVLMRTLANINLGVFIFNMIPGFPLDGGRILRAIIWARKKDLRRATLIASRIGRGFAYTLIALGTLGFVAYGSMIGGLWMVFIGLFLRKAAIDSYRTVAYREVLGDIRIGDIMRREAITVEGSLDLMTLVNDYFLKYHFGAFPVLRDGKLSGMVFLDDVRSVPRERWVDVSVEEIARKDAVSYSVREDEAAGRLFHLIIQKGYSLVPVSSSEGEIVGMVTRRDFSEVIKVMTSLVK